MELSKTVIVNPEESITSSEQYNPSSSSSFKERKYVSSGISERFGTSGSSSFRSSASSGEGSAAPGGKYEIITELGSGAQGAVYKAIRRSDGKVIALKVLNVQPGTSKYEQAINEATMLEKISQPQCNPFLSCYYGHSYTNGQLYIEMEFINGVTLKEYSTNLFSKQEYEKLYKHLLLILKDITKGLKLVHSLGIIHNDIKPENIIIDKQLTPKLVDFGLACKTQLCDNNVQCCPGYSGSPYYASPEMIKTHIRYEQSDVWSLGMTIYHCSTNGYPYDFPEFKTVIGVLYIISNEIPKLLNTENKILNEIVNKSLILDPFNRITLDEIAEVLKN